MSRMSTCMPFIMGWLNGYWNAFPLVKSLLLWAHKIMRQPFFTVTHTKRLWKPREKERERNDEINKIDEKFLWRFLMVEKLNAKEGDIIFYFPEMNLAIFWCVFTQRKSGKFVTDCGIQSISCHSNAIVVLWCWWKTKWKSISVLNQFRCFSHSLKTFHKFWATIDSDWVRTKEEKFNVRFSFIRLQNLIFCVRIHKNWSVYVFKSRYYETIQFIRRSEVDIMQAKCNGCCLHHRNT